MDERGEDPYLPLAFECFSSGEPMWFLKNQGLELDLTEKPKVDGVFRSLERETLGVEKGEDRGLAPVNAPFKKGLELAGASIVRGTSLLCE